jgi:hypothetical protein
MQVSEMLKNPWVIGGGVVVVALVLMTSGGKSSGDNGAVALGSQQVASATNVRLSEIDAARYAATMAYNTEAMKGNIALQIAAMSSANQTLAITSQQAIASQGISAGVTKHVVSVRGALEADRINAALKAFLGPMAAQTSVAVAQIEASSRERQAQIAADSNRSMAEWYAATRLGSTALQQYGSGNSGFGLLGDLFEGVGTLFDL